MEHRVGVFLCACGTNIEGALRLDAVASAAGRLPGVVRVRTAATLCRGADLAALTADLAELRPTGVVLGACAPREQEATFRRALEAAGLDPHLLQMANLREQCAWVTPDPSAATAKAAALVRAAVARVAHHQALPARRITCRAEVLVVGAGVAGVAAATALARAGRPVVLVERRFHVGGRVVTFEALAPGLGCGTCAVGPSLDALLHDDRVTFFTGAEIERVVGFPGHYRARIRERARGVDPGACVGCGACAAVCPGEGSAVAFPFPGALPHAPVIDRARCRHGAPDPCTACRDACAFGAANPGAADRHHDLEVGAVILATGFDITEPPAGGPGAAVATALDLEEWLWTDGATRGVVALANGRPPRTVRLDYRGPEPLWPALGRKHGELLRQRLPGVRVLGPDSADPPPDLTLVLPRLGGAPGSAALARALGVALDGAGFVASTSNPLDPTATTSPGVFAAGGCRGLGDVTGAAAQGQAAAARVLGTLRPGEVLELDAAVAVMDPARCGGCLACLGGCAHGALSPAADSGVRVDPVLCRGCGTCAAGCPAGAATLLGTTDAQLMAELWGCLAPPEPEAP